MWADLVPHALGPWLARCGQLINKGGIWVFCGQCHLLDGCDQERYLHTIV